MTKKGLFEVSLKIFGLFMLIMAFDGLTSSLMYATYFLDEPTERSNEDLVYFSIYMTKFIVYTLGFWLAVFKSEKIANYLMKTNSTSTAIDVNKDDLLQVLLSTSGIMITYFSIGDFWNSLTMASVWDYENLPEKYRNSIYLMQLGIPLTKGLAGIGLIFGSSRLVRFTGNLSKKQNG